MSNTIKRLGKFQNSIFFLNQGRHKYVLLENKIKQLLKLLKIEAVIIFFTKQFFGICFTHTHAP